MQGFGRLALMLFLLPALIGGPPASGLAPAFADDIPAKQLFGAAALPAKMNSQPVGFYSKGCLAGGIAIPVDGPAWQVMRLSRNRRWGHPDLVRIIEELSVKAKADGWNGLMVGDMSQPRGGPMLTGHASHQVGLDVDIWFMPMPDKRLTYNEREQLSAVSVLKRGSVYVDDARWTPAHEKVLHDAAAFPEVQRILVHPGVKKKLCDTVKGDRKWLAKIRPYYGHHYHFHVRIRCPKDATNCKPQAAVPDKTQCDDGTLDWWFDTALKPKKPKKTDKAEKPKKPRYTRLRDLPPACATILNAADVAPNQTEYRISASTFSAPAIEIPVLDTAAILASKPIEGGKKVMAGGIVPALEDVPVPTPRPAN